MQSFSSRIWTRVTVPISYDDNNYTTGSFFNHGHLLKVTVIPIVIGALWSVSKGLERELEKLEIGGQIQTIETTALLGSARIMRIVLEIWGDLMSLRFRWKAVS